MSNGGVGLVTRTMARVRLKDMVADDDLVCPPPVPACDYPARRLAVYGGKPKLGRISKMGNRNLRKLLVVGARAVVFHGKPHTDPLRMWAKKLIEKKPFKLVAVALANKMARIAFAILRSKTVYREIPA